MGNCGSCCRVAARAELGWPLALPAFERRYFEDGRAVCEPSWVASPWYCGRTFSAPPGRSGARNSRRELPARQPRAWLDRRRAHARARRAVAHLPTSWTPAASAFWSTAVAASWPRSLLRHSGPPVSRPTQPGARRAPLRGERLSPPRSSTQRGAATAASSGTGTETIAAPPCALSFGKASMHPRPPPRAWPAPLALALAHRPATLHPLPPHPAQQPAPRYAPPLPTTNHHPSSASAPPAAPPACLPACQPLPTSLRRLLDVLHTHTNSR